MTLLVSKSALKPKLLSYLRRVERQRVAITVTDRGEPVAQIVPFSKRKKNRKPLLGSVLKYEAPLEPVGEEAWDLKL